jgi:DNA primase
MGNSLSETQAQKLADHFDRVTLMLDGDRPDAKPP